MWHGVVIFFLSSQKESAKPKFGDIYFSNLSECFTIYDLYYTSLEILNIYPTRDNKKIKKLNLRWTGGLNNENFPKLKN